MSSAVAARPRARELRRWWRGAHPPPGLLKRLEPVYYVFITLAIGGPLVYGTASAALAEVATPDGVGTWGPSVALVGVLALVRWGAVQGPVVFSVADVAHLLGAPLRRRDLTLGRLLRGLLIGAGGAAVVAGLVLVGVAGGHRTIAVDRAAAFVAAAALLGLLGVAGASLVQGSARWDRGTRLAVWPALALAVALVVVGGSGADGRRIALWCGPWAWAVQPAAGGGSWQPAVALLALLTAGAVGLALVRRGVAPTERHLVRAEARGGAVAALGMFNARYVRRSLTAVSAGPAAAARARLRPPGHPRWAIPWRDATAALAAPQRLAAALALAAAGTLIALLDADRPVAVGVGALATYAAAAALLEPLRAETDRPGRVHTLLIAPIGRVLAAHVVVPAAVVLAGAVLAAAGCAIAGALPAHGALVAALALAATPSITLCAALSARRGGRVPSSVLALAQVDQSGAYVLLALLWIVVFPVLAILLGTLPVASAARHGTASPPVIVLLLAAPPALLAGLRAARYAP